MDGLKEKNGNFWNRYQNRMRGIQKGRLSVLLLALLLFFPAAALVQPVSAAAGPAVTLDYSEYTILKGSKEKLKASILDEELDSAKIVWTVSNDAVVAVNQGGAIRGKKAGTAKVTAAIEGTTKQASCTVRVVNKPKNKKNAAEAKALKQLIASLPQDAAVSRDADHANEYIWEDFGKESRLTGISWSKKGLSGAVSIAGFEKLESVDVSGNQLSGLEI